MDLASNGHKEFIIVGDRRRLNLNFSKLCTHFIPYTQNKIMNIGVRGGCAVLEFANCCEEISYERSLALAFCFLADLG